METMESEQFFLKWNNFENNLTSGFADLLQQEAMVDVTLAAEGRIIQAHKVILSICSSYFRNMFQLNPCQHPIVVLKDVGFQELTDMLDFMYKGEANVRQEDLPSFLKLAETLKVKGLAGSSTESDEGIKKNSETHLSNSTKDTLPNEKCELSNDGVDENIMLRKKRKRPISPYKNSTFKSLPYSPNIKLEIADCDDHFVENNIGKVDHDVAMKGERLSDSSLYSCEYNTSSRNEKDAGPSTLDDSYETIPQEIFQASEYTFIETSYGGRLLVLYGYCYRRKIVKGERSYWFCSKAKCTAKGILRSDGTFQLRQRNHNHELNFDEIKKRKKLSELKKLALKLNIPGQDLLKKLNINEDSKKYLSFIRTWRCRSKKQSVGRKGQIAPLQVGLNYKLLTTRGTSKGMILCMGYLYRQDSLNPSKKECKYWRCKVKGCKARAKTDEVGNLTVIKPEHLHPPSLPHESGKISSEKKS